MKSLMGTGVALVTPLHEDRSVDYKSLGKLLSHTARGVDYYVVMGTTGESATLNSEEKKEVLQFVKSHNRKNLPIVYGIGGNNTAHVVAELKTTDLNGVTAILSVSPYYNKPSQEGIYQHFITIANKSQLPLILYNVPGRTGSNITAATTLRLSKHKNIIGIKEASGNLEQCMTIAYHRPEGFMLISGDDMLTLAMYALGGDGVISVLANALPVHFKKIKENFQNHIFRKAQDFQFQLIDINGPMYEEGNPVGLKYLLSLLGITQPFTRLPLTTASLTLQQKIKSALKKINA